MEDQTLTGETAVTTQDVFTPEQDPVAAIPVVEQPDAAQAAADATDNSIRQVQVDDDTSTTQLIGAQMARARNALAHLEETVARDVHAALAEIESLLGMKG